MCFQDRDTELCESEMIMKANCSMELVGFLQNLLGLKYVGML